MFRKLLAVVFALGVLFAGAADARRICPILCGKGAGGGAGGPYLGMVATRGNVASGQNTGLHYANTRSWHIAMDNISSIGVVFGNWRNSIEVITGIGSATYTASIEYPANNLTQVTWSGAGSVVFASGQQLLSDMITLSTPIPKGAMFWIRNFQVQPTGILFASAGPVWTPSGDALEYSATVIADQTLNPSHTYVNGSGGAPQFPYAIVGMTKLPAVLLIGDSRAQGDGTDTPTSTGALGELARSIDPSFAYSNAGASGDAAFSFVSGVPGTNGQNLNRIALGNYATHVLFNYGINDVGSGNNFTLAQVQANIRAAWALFPTKKVMHITIPPNTGSTFSVTSITAVANLCTVTASGAQFLTLPTQVTISGASPAAYNGTFNIINVVHAGASSTFQYTAGSSPGTSPATGTIVATDKWATEGNQTATGNFPINGTGVRDGLNAWLLTKPSPLVAVFDVSSTLAAGAFGDIWNAPDDGTAASIQTVDGLHENQAGYLVIKNSGVINPAAITYP